jgi:hypothetical protein
MIASITELHLKNFFSFIRFLPHAIKSKIQADKAEGRISVDLNSEGLLIQRTLTLWESKDSMMKYVRSGHHLEAMKIFKKIAKTSYTANFEVTEAPTWGQALKVLKENGRAHHT